MRLAPQLSVSWLHRLPVLSSVAVHAGAFGNHIPPPDDFPGVGLIEASDIESKLDEAVAATRANARRWGRTLYEEYISWLNAAKAANRSLATFLY